MILTLMKNMWKANLKYIFVLHFLGVYFLYLCTYRYNYLSTHYLLYFPKCDFK
ncbi:hypothetical protein NQ314_013091 [Rhamnusium bicolor]|uniref:Uncharacterized protein n=1 Tax=Rhamnusium bicolor TaxID=1586634 RepID=A0AAV8X7N3_9CUCU|nr:hypothetical protein NQ314_013091 [Rhamnusium bicolor]